VSRERVRSPERGAAAYRPAPRSPEGPHADDRRHEAERLDTLQRAASDRTPSPAAQVIRRAASRVASGSVVQRVPNAELVEALKRHFPGTDRLSKAKIIEGLATFPEKSRKNTGFARALVEFVKARNGADFEITDLHTAPDPKFGRKHLAKSWTFRHYTNEQHESLQSLADLEAEGVKAAKNTNDRDWEELGNQGYVFGLIAIDGQVPKRTWLGRMKYYAEYDLSKLGSVWVSADMLTEEGRRQESFEGAGVVIIAQLSKMLGYEGQDEATAIDQKFGGALEAKVPSGLLGPPDWKPNPDG
jgi:hypothetical protein